MSYTEDQAAIAEFIRNRGATRCPTACLVPTQGSVTLADKMALLRHAHEREEHRQQKLQAAMLAVQRTGPALRS